ncbi:MAG: AbrB/MazE/SpoVT family DNA-binding domain-containing protein [Gammaproteobacteria bacterium]
MQTQVIRKIGNSEGVIIPKALLESLGLSLGRSVDLELVDGQLILRPNKRKYTLEGLVAQMLPEHEAPEIPVGSEVGEEVVEYEVEKEVHRGKSKGA